MENKDKMERHMEQKIKYYTTKVFKILFYILLGLAIAFLVGYIVMQLWNWLMPELFGLPEVDYWQAVGILILAKIIFGFGSGDGPGKSGNSKKHSGPRKCGSLRKDFTEWKHYDEFWKEEGEQAYNNYLERIQNEKKN
ncbi:hypothetical protein [Maribacter sp. 2304DJ31-5]|uniref:hypothetical protein n=1 Tax=Maribacter sp. 2304DJ31-5 TaxID=3386273 RepID=UPI0039BCDE11